MALHYNISLHKSNPKNSKRNILTKKKKNKNTLKTKTEDKSLTCPFYVFVAVVVLFFTIRIQDVGRPYQMGAFESVRLSYPVRIERA